MASVRGTSSITIKGITAFGSRLSDPLVVVAAAATGAGLTEAGAVVGAAAVAGVGSTAAGALVVMVAAAVVFVSAEVGVAALEERLVAVKELCVGTPLAGA